MTTPAPRRCRLHELLGRVESCPKAACALWEPGASGQEGSCAVADLDLEALPEAVGWLLRVRNELETASTPVERDSALKQLAEARDLIARLSRVPRRH